LNNQIPSLRLHYRNFFATMNTVRLPAGISGICFSKPYILLSSECSFCLLPFKFIRQVLPSSLSKPVTDSCHLNNGGHAASNQVAATLVLPYTESGEFCHTTSDLFDTSSMVHFRSPPCYITDFFRKPFPHPFTTSILQLKQREAF
jgi:hypothetical protein